MLFCLYQFFGILIQPSVDQGDYHKIFWKNNSLYLHDDILFELKLEDLFYEVNSSYDPFGKVEMDRTYWQQIYKVAY